VRGAVYRVTHVILGRCAPDGRPAGKLGATGAIVALRGRRNCQVGTAGQGRRRARLCWLTRGGRLLAGWKRARCGRTRPESGKGRSGKRAARTGPPGKERSGPGKGKVGRGGGWGAGWAAGEERGECWAGLGWCAGLGLGIFGFPSSSFLSPTLIKLLEFKSNLNSNPMHSTK